MAHEHHVVQILPLQDVHDIPDVRFESNTSVEKMGALAEAGERWREHYVTALSEPIGHPTPAPASAPASVDENEVARVHGRVRHHLGAAQAKGACHDPAEKFSSGEGQCHQQLSILLGFSVEAHDRSRHALSSGAAASARCLTSDALAAETPQVCHVVRRDLTWVFFLDTLHAIRSGILSCKERALPQS